MAAGAPPTLRTPMILLAAASLVVLGAQLWPWQEAVNLPGDGTVALDPAISLLAYMGAASRNQLRKRCRRAP